jgi:hypothetical protein
MEKNNYDQTVGKMFQQELHTSMVYLSQHRFTKDLSETQLLLLSASTERYRIDKNTIICTQG